MQECNVLFSLPPTTLHRMELGGTTHVLCDGSCDKGPELPSLPLWLVAGRSRVECKGVLSPLHPL